MKPNLSGVPETMLWTLYNRAKEAKRADRVLDDPESIRIFESIDYDYARSFGDPDASHALRALESDRLLRAWMSRHPGGTVVSLGEGLETQALRVDDGRVRWVSIDMPEAIAVRERFIPATERRVHLAKSALDSSWLDTIDATHGVFIIAQGLFMYFTESDVRGLLGAIGARFPGAELFFDVIPPWFSDRTMKGAMRTPNYQLPKMPWGVKVSEVEGFVRSCMPRVTAVKIIPYRFPRGFFRLLRVLELFGVGPTMVHVQT